MNTENLLAKLNGKFPNSPITRLAASGNWSAAADSAAAHGVWGIWAECREAAGLSADDTARNDVLAAMKVAKASKFAR